ncbi:MAG: hypothetical protein C1943_07845 [Halochromatium sp.]|nr:hypothetical protein [Halochromatium sp.]
MAPLTRSWVAPLGRSVTARTDSFKEAIRLAVALGGDTDSTAAVCGQVAGAYYGLSAIPEPWKAELVKRDEVFAVAERLCQAGCAGL